MILLLITFFSFPLLAVVSCSVCERYSKKFCINGVLADTQAVLNSLRYNAIKKATKLFEDVWLTSIELTI